MLFAHSSYQLSQLSCACPLSVFDLFSSLFWIVLQVFENLKQQAWLLIGVECEKPRLFHRAEAMKYQDSVKN